MSAGLAIERVAICYGCPGRPPCDHFRAPFGCELSVDGRAHATDITWPCPAGLLPTTAAPAPQPTEPQFSIVGWLAHGAAEIIKTRLGVGRAPDDIIAARLAACEACPHFRAGGLLRPAACELMRPADGGCGCGCFVGEVVMRANQSCPDMPPRWGPISLPVRGG